MEIADMLAEAKQKRELAFELRRKAGHHRAVVWSRSVPVATLEEIGHIGLLEYQADRLCEQASQIEREWRRRPWWYRLAAVVGVQA